MRIRSIFRSFVVVALATACGGGNPPATTAPSSATTPSATAPASSPAPGGVAPASAFETKTLAQKIDETMKALTEAWNAHDADKVAAAYSENGVLKVIGTPDAVGHAAIKAQAADVFKAYPDFKVTVTRVIAKGNTAFVEWVITGTNNGDSDLMKLKATKRPIGIHGIDVSTFDDAGRVKEDHRYYDLPTQMSQLDAKAKAGTFRAVAPAPTSAPAVAMAKGSPDEDKNLDATKALYKAMEGHKSDAILANVTPDGMMEDYAQPAPLKGAKAIKGYLDAMFKAIPDLSQDVTTQIAAGDLVATEGMMKGTMKGALGPMKATNKPVSMHFVDIMQIKDGKVVNGWSYGNSMEMMPPPPAPAAK